MPAPEPTLVEFVRYNLWANRRLLEICAGLDEDLLNAPIPGSAGSILETFRHLLNAEAEFLTRIYGSGPEPGFAEEGSPTVEALAEFAERTGASWLETIERVSPTQNVHEEANGWTFDYDARLIFMSLAYHGIAHRTDITTFLHREGIPLPELDVWGYQSDFPGRFRARLVRDKDGNP